MDYIDSVSFPDDGARIIRDFHRLAVLANAERYRVVPGLEKIVRSLTPEQHVVTAGYAETFRRAAAALLPRFTSITGFEHGEKTDLLAKFSGSASVYITDSKVDVARCTKLNIPTIGVTWGVDDKTALLDAGAVRICTSPSLLLKSLKAWGPMHSSTPKRSD